MRAQVLIIEDDWDIREAFADVLTSAGFSVSQAPNGADGLAQARSTHPDLILLDLMMPQLDGWGFLEAQRGDPAIADIPVVIVSASVPDGASVARFGGVEILHKPVALNDLLEIVSRCAARDVRESSELSIP